MHFASFYRWKVVTEYLKLPLQVERPVLDIGGDDGEFLFRVRAPYKVGVDLMAKPSANVDWVQADGCRLPFTSRSFGFIFAFDVIEHVEHDLDLLHEACRVLEPGGTLWLSTTATNYKIFPGGRVQKRFEDAWGHVRRGYTQEALLSRLPDSVEVEFRYWNEPVFRTFYTFLYLMKRLNGKLATDLAGRLVPLDARAQSGESGHVFARVVLSSPDKSWAT